ncbi:glutathione S-transferase family protein [Pseudoruegeria sp. SK021]|uniref:glutathione S-transferase family protein n=1 Tax=Pseudoruegeria sp. SK021 TaxID=1933035 RepID=UPI000A2390E4|nr:glutathione S-transferase family protein [Pseudoruegeria sp. SK021]OSP56320.1 glutathione S-transferase [Pseudoruegeria sp. SK021]
MTIKLYCFGESGNAYKAALALELSGLSWEPVHVDFFNGGARTPEFRAINPMGEVPVMIDEATGYTLTQSGAIQDYVTEVSGKLGGDTPEARREILRWTLWDNHKLSGLNGATRFLMNFLPPEKRPAEVIAFQQNRLTSSYTILNEHLADRDWIVGDRPTMADLSCCGYLFYPEPFGFDRADWPHIDTWMLRIMALHGWKAPYDLMPGSPADRT